MCQRDAAGAVPVGEVVVVVCSQSAAVHEAAFVGFALARVARACGQFPRRSQWQGDFAINGALDAFEVQMPPGGQQGGAVADVVRGVEEIESGQPEQRRAAPRRGGS